MRVAPAICEAGRRVATLGGCLWHAMQILPNAAYLQRLFPTGASLHNHQYWQQFGNSRTTNFPPPVKATAPKSAPQCGFSALEDRASGLLCVTRHVEGWYCKEETCSGTGRAAFAPEHRRLHQHAPAADGDEGVMTGLLEWGVGGGPVIGPALFLSIGCFSLPRIPRRRINPSGREKPL